ncbi:mucin-binding protein, partial [Limosilactobacillus agrestis]|uniref:mucin-binding protein n=2 Tax=Limosilactobacillus agrestis TaxID=2759748 RepID=UPI001E5EAA00
MLSKNNGQEQIRKQESKKQRFAIKKLTVGVASVLVGFTFMGLNASASADDTPTQPAKNDDNNVSSDTTNELQQSNVSLTTTEATDTAVKNNVSQTTDNSVDKASNVEANSASQKYEQSIAEKMKLYKTSLVAVNNPNGDSQETNAPQQTTTLTSAPLYTTQGQVPTLDMNNMFTQEQLSQYGDNPQIDWVNAPDVSKIGNVTGTAKLTYEEVNADSAEDGAVSTKTATVNVPVLVRKAEQEVKEDQVKNSLDVINSSNNSLVAHYEWVGDKAANDEDEEISIPGRDAFESNFMTIIEKLGFESDDYSEFPEDLMTFGTKNKSVTMFVHPVSTDPVIADDPYFNADGNSSIDNVNETPDPANYIGNLGTLPEGTKIEWNDVPTYDYTKDEDGNYTNPEPTNSPSIKVTIPGKNPIILDSDPNGDPLKEIATLPAYGDGTLLLNSNNELELGSSAKTPINYVANFDSFSKKYLEDSDKEANADNVQDLKDSFKWTIAPNTQQAGYTFGVFKYGDGNVGNLILFKVNSTEDVTKTDADAKSIVTETINVTTPDGKTTPIVKSVTFNRTATKDLVTGDVSYGAWSDNGTYTFPSYTVSTVAGYTPSQTEVPAQTVKPGDKNLVFNITYSAIEQTRKIVFVDNGNTVGTQPLTGKTGTSVTIGNGDGETPLKVPTGYEVVPGTEIPTTVPFNATDNPDITVQVQAKKNTDDGRNDKGNKDVYREVTRIITVNIEGQAPQTVTQTLAFYRIKTTNEATGKVSYTDWTSNMEDGATSFPEVEIPSVAGYTRTITGGTITTKDGKDYVAAQSGLANGEPVNNITVTVDYEKADHTQLINYV